MDPIKLLVIGGSGFIGNHLLEEGLKRDYEVFSLSLGNRETKKNVKNLVADLTKEDTLQKTIAEYSFDYIIHCGGYINHTPFSSGGENVIQEHLNSLYSLVKVLKKDRLKKFLYIGSSDEYGNSPAPQNESMREAPISPYSYAKAAASHFLQMLYRTEKFPASIARLFLTYGPGQDDKRFLPQIIKGCLDDKEFPTSLGEQFRDFCYISDTVDGCFRILDSEKSSGEIFNISSGEKVTIRAMIEEVTRIIGKGKPLFGKISYRVGENMELYADISKARNILGWKPKVSLKEGLEKTINYYKS